MSKILFSLLIAALAAQAAGAAAPPPLKRTKELRRAEAMYILGSKEQRSKKVLRIAVLIPAGMTESELIAVSDHYRAKYAATEILDVVFWDDAAAYELDRDEVDEPPAAVTDHLKARYEKDPFRVYGKPVHCLTLLRPKRRTIDY